MKKKEISLFKALCSYKNDTFDQNLLTYATPIVLGQLFFNRMQGVAYYSLQKHNLLSKINREFRNSLKSAFDSNQKRNESYFECINYVEGVLKPYHGKYAMLKGAYLCQLYPRGGRTSNDIDLLVLPEDTTSVGEKLINEGFRQGNIRDNAFIPATRKQIIESKMMKGETVPYIKEVNLPEMKFLEIDINFSLDYKNDDGTIQKILNNTISKDINGMTIQTLNETDFFIHLCCHLYKEATTLPWIKMKRDMTLYKYCDIYLLLLMMDNKNIDNIFMKAKELSLSEICAFAILQTSELFDRNNDYAVLCANDVLKSDSLFLHRVISPKDGKFLEYEEKNITNRFFCDDREKLLKEVK